MIAKSVSAHAKRARQNSGFTLLELLVVVALAAILMALAAPSLRDFIVRNKMSSISNEFTGSLLKARNEAVSKNTCVTMCMSTTIDAVGTGASGPVCATTGSDWQVGWIAFLDPGCTNPAFPASEIDMLFVRRGDVSDYHLSLPDGSTLRSIVFGARGLNGLAYAGRFDLRYKELESKETTKFGSSICLNALGRPRTITPAGADCG